MRILLIDDNVDFSKALQEALMASGEQVDTAFNLQEAENLVETYQYDLWICDVALREGETAGFTLVENARKQGHTVPILFLTGAGQLDDLLKGFQSGADDYLIKPIRLLELQARLQALYRRSRSIVQTTLTLGTLSIEWSTQRVTQGGEEVRLTGREYAILEFLAARSGEFFSRENILEHIWGPGYPSEHNIVEVYIRTLRKKLGQDIIENVRGRGYRISQRT